MNNWPTLIKGLKQNSPGLTGELNDQQRQNPNL